MGPEENKIARKVVYAPAIGELELDTISLLWSVMEHQGQELDDRARARIATWFSDKYNKEANNEKQ